MNIEENKDITKYTTFGIEVKARWFAEYTSERELLHLSRDERFIAGPVMQIGGGSNLLFLHDFDGMVIHSAIKGIKRYDKDADTVYAIAGSGEKWADMVEWAVAQGLGGMENMAGIPGEVGAAPVQNVGAYGAEAKDVIYSVECFDTHTRTTRLFTAAECRFGYRDSFFKHEGKGRFIVLRVCFKLIPDTKARNLEYGPLKDLAARLGHTPSIREVADEIILIRDSKLPRPEDLGSAGSFFKNPVVHKGYYQEIERLTGEHPSAFQIDEYHMKMSAAWLIDHAGMKGARVGGARVYDNQPLVIVNDGTATADDVRTLAEQIRERVRAQFMVDLNPEVNYIDTDVQVTILGTGTSKGIPEVGCSCRVCKSEGEKDKRLRTSALLRTMGITILIDPSPDFRAQALAQDIHHIDAVLITHSHYDHVGGLDDLRPFCADGKLPLYVREDVAEDLRNRLDYCFVEHPYPGVPTFDLRVIGNREFYISGIKIVPIEVMHGKKPIYGYRIGNFAYITDAKTIDEQELEKLEGVDTLVVNALRDKDHFAHFTLQEALDLIKEVSPREAYLTHFNHEIGRHEEIEARTPENVHPAYDGMHIIVK